jgi:SAM-dependent methyltransferase
MGAGLETARSVQEPLQAALVEAILPYCGRPGRRPQRGPSRRPVAAAGTADGADGAGADGADGTAVPPLNQRQWLGIGRDVLALHEGYTQRRGAFAHEANPIHARLPAYQLYYLPRNWYRVHRVLQQLPWAHARQAAVPEAWLEPTGAAALLRLLDLGCGSGAFSLAWLGWLAERRGADAPPLTVRLTLVDQGRQLLELAQANLRAYARRVLPGVTLHCDVHADGVEAFLAGRAGAAPYAVAGAAMALNELDLLGPRRVSQRAAALADALQARLRPGGCLLLVEPGTRKGYMNLMALREHLLELPALYPCPHNRPCPMWGGTVRNWCHATERLPPGFFFDATLRQRAGLSFEMRDLQLAALAVQALPGTQAAPPFRPRRGERIVSAPLRPRGPQGATPDTGARVVLACAPDGRLHERPAPPGGVYTRGEWSGPAPEGAL